MPNEQKRPWGIVRWIMSAIGLLVLGFVAMNWYRASSGYCFLESTKLTDRELRLRAMTWAQDRGIEFGKTYEERALYLDQHPDCCQVVHLWHVLPFIGSTGWGFHDVGFVLTGSSQVTGEDFKKWPVARVVNRASACGVIDAPTDLEYRSGTGPDARIR